MEFLGKKNLKRTQKISPALSPILGAISMQPLTNLSTLAIYDVFFLENMYQTKLLTSSGTTNIAALPIAKVTYSPCIFTPFHHF